MNNKRRFRDSCGDKIVEFDIPIRVYIYDKNYDGWEFGLPLGCSRHQKRLLNEVKKEIINAGCCEAVVSYMGMFHSEEWQKILNLIDAESVGVPQEFIDAFKDK